MDANEVDMQQIRSFIRGNGADFCLGIFDIGDLSTYLKRNGYSIYNESEKTQLCERGARLDAESALARAALDDDIFTAVLLLLCAVCLVVLMFKVKRIMHYFKKAE